MTKSKKAPPRPIPIPVSYNLKDTCYLLGLRSRQSLAQVCARLSIRTYRAGPVLLYDAKDVEAAVDSLQRRRGLVILGRLHPKAKLKPVSFDYDTRCPDCQGWALGDPEESPAIYLSLQTSRKWPRRVWCPLCGVVLR